MTRSSCQHDAQLCGVHASELGTGNPLTFSAKEGTGLTGPAISDRTGLLLGSAYLVIPYGGCHA